MDPVFGLQRPSMFDGESGEIALRLLIALAVGAAIGAERSYRGRPAGFRTHALVCLASSLLMLIVAFEHRWAPHAGEARITLDPTRMAQGIMTGIGFLGAGAIMREGLTVRGLTTAASIWVTAAIGVLVGIGFYTPAVMATVMTLGTLSVFNWVEKRMPQQFYAHLVVRFERLAAMSEPQMRAAIAQHGFSIANLNYRLDDKDNFFEYRMVIASSQGDNVRRLVETLNGLESVREFRVSPTGD
jgi:putative Mg2+ transporter-C (MgtC) family protein